MEAMRKELRERLEHPGRFATSPRSLKDIPDDEIAEANLDLWFAADDARHSHQEREDRSNYARMDRRKERLDTGIIVGIAAYAIWRWLGHRSVKVRRPCGFFPPPLSRLPERVFC
jgi:hypothetical protein